MFTGLAPIAQPPGSDTSALPKRATSGPSTRIEARMVFTSSYGAKHSFTVEPSTSMRMRSSMVTVAPIRPSSSTVVVTSLRCGTLETVTGSSASSAPARIGRVAFFAPEMRTSPSRGTPPWICSLSMSALARFFGSERFDRERVDFPPHALAERLVDELVAGDGALADEFTRNDACGKVRVVVRFDPHLRNGEGGADQLCNLFRIHA